MTIEELAVKIKKMFELRKQIKAVQTERTEGEKALNIQYKVDECNQAKNALSMNCQKQIHDLSKQIYDLEDEIGG